VTGEGEEPEITSPKGAVPWPIAAVPAVLLAGCLAVGAVPGIGEAVSRAADTFVSHDGYTAAVLGGAGPPPETSIWPGWTPSALASALASTALAVLLAAAALWGPRPAGRGLPARLAAATGNLHHAVRPLRRLHSGLVGDYVAWLTVGMACLLTLVNAMA
jgi:multicomponent Na+:H+ antiporter subunit D